jgi:hypothetical protein
MGEKISDEKRLSKSPFTDRPSQVYCKTRGEVNEGIEGQTIDESKSASCESLPTRG